MKTVVSTEQKGEFFNYWAFSNQERCFFSLKSSGQYSIPLTHRTVDNTYLVWKHPITYKMAFALFDWTVCKRAIIEERPFCVLYTVVAKCNVQLWKVDIFAFLSNILLKMFLKIVSTFHWCVWGV